MTLTDIRVTEITKKLEKSSGIPYCDYHITFFTLRPSHKLNTRFFDGNISLMEMQFDLHPETDELSYNYDPSKI